MVFKWIAVISNVTLDTLKAPEEVKVPHRATKFAISHDVKTIFFLFRNDFLDEFSFSLLVAVEVIVKWVLDVITLFDLALVFSKG